MICHIVACGPSGAHWNGEGYSIGVNDCAKWGHKVDNLIVVNSLNSFPARKKIVEDTRPREKLFGISCWCHHPSYQHIGYMNAWRGRLEKGKIYKSISSPFIAVTMAYRMGYDKIILWGVDFINHQSIWGSKADREVLKYADLQRALRAKGASMYLGATADFTNEGALKDVLPNFRVL